MELSLIFLIAHLFGVALGAGGAFASDMMFLYSVKDERVSATEIGFLKLGSKMVWAGLALLVLSGIGLFMQKPDFYLASPKFLVKMTIIGIILLNGIFFHLLHIPRLMRHSGEHFPSSDEFTRKRPYLVASGAISFTSWSSALILGAIKDIPLSYVQIFAAYAIFLSGAVFASLLAQDLILPGHRK